MLYLFILSKVFQYFFPFCLHWDFSPLKTKVSTVFPCVKGDCFLSFLDSNCENFGSISLLPWVHFWRQNLLNVMESYLFFRSVITSYFSEELKGISYVSPPFDFMLDSPLQIDEELQFILIFEFCLIGLLIYLLFINVSFVNRVYCSRQFHCLLNLFQLCSWKEGMCLQHVERSKDLSAGPLSLGHQTQVQGLAASTFPWGTFSPALLLIALYTRVIFQQNSIVVLVFIVLAFPNIRKSTFSNIALVNDMLKP